MQNLITYQANALRTEKPLPTVMARLRHAALGLITETGEIATEVKRMVIYDRPLDELDTKANKTRRQHIAEEIGDVMWYLAIASATLENDIFGGLMVELVPQECADIEMETLRLAQVVGFFTQPLFEPSFGEDEAEYLVDSILPEIARSLVNLSGLIAISIDDIAAENIAKLRKRFPDAYSNEAAEARADKGGLDARNS